MPAALIDLHKAAIYMKTGQLDLAGYYFSKAKKDKMDSLGAALVFGITCQQSITCKEKST